MSLFVSRLQVIRMGFRERETVNIPLLIKRQRDICRAQRSERETQHFVLCVQTCCSLLWLRRPSRWVWSWASWSEPSWRKPAGRARATPAWKLSFRTVWTAHRRVTGLRRESEVKPLLSAEPLFYFSSHVALIWGSLFLNFESQRDLKLKSDLCIRMSTHVGTQTVKRQRVRTVGDDWDLQTKLWILFLPGDDPLEKLRKLQREKLCKICMDKDVSIVFIPCGHLVSCKECSVMLTKCPICCGAIAQKIKTYISWGERRLLLPNVNAALSVFIILFML